MEFKLYKQFICNSKVHKQFSPNPGIDFIFMKPYMSNAMIHLQLGSAIRGNKEHDLVV